MCFGSNTDFKVAIVFMTFSVFWRCKYYGFIKPRPCSADIEPFSWATYSKINGSIIPSNSDSLVLSKQEMFKCRFPSAMCPYPTVYPSPLHFSLKSFVRASISFELREISYLNTFPSSQQAGPTSSLIFHKLSYSLSDPARMLSLMDSLCVSKT